MGSFYVNITARTPAKEAVSFLENKGMNAYVMPTKENECVIFEEKCDTQDVAYLYELLVQLTSDKECSALGVLNHDDDMLFLMLCSKGELVADYTCGMDFDEMFEDSDEEESLESDEDLYDDEAALTDEKKAEAKIMAEALSKTFNTKDSEAIYNVLIQDFVFAGMEAHESLVDVLNLPEIAIALGYNYISEGQMEEDFDKSKLIEVKADNS